MMKTKLIYTTAMLVYALSGKAQAPAGNTLTLYGSFGSKFLQKKNFFYSTNVSPATATITGGGFILQKHNLQLGLELYYAKGSTHPSTFHSDYSGLSSNVLAGYGVNLTKKYKLSLQTGVGYTLNHMYVTNRQHKSAEHLNTAVFHNFGFTAPLSAMIQHTSRKGLVVGLKAGYNLNIRFTQTWKYRGAEGEYKFNPKPEGFYLQLTFGGLLNLN